MRGLRNNTWLSVMIIYGNLIVLQITSIYPHYISKTAPWGGIVTYHQVHLRDDHTMQTCNLRCLHYNITAVQHTPPRKVFKCTFVLSFFVHQSLPCELGATLWLQYNPHCYSFFSKSHHLLSVPELQWDKANSEVCERSFCLMFWPLLILLPHLCLQSVQLSFSWEIILINTTSSTFGSSPSLHLPSYFISLWYLSLKLWR